MLAHGEAQSTKDRREDFEWKNLFAQAEAGNQGPIALDVLALQVVEQLAALADQAQQTTTGVVVLLVLLEVAGQIVDAGGSSAIWTSGNRCRPWRAGNRPRWRLCSVVIAISNSLFGLERRRPGLIEPGARLNKFPVGDGSAIISAQDRNCTRRLGQSFLRPISRCRSGGRGRRPGTAALPRR